MFYEITFKIILHIAEHSIQSTLSPAAFQAKNTRLKRYRSSISILRSSSIDYTCLPKDHPIMKFKYYGSLYSAEYEFCICFLHQQQIFLKNVRKLQKVTIISAFYITCILNVV